MFTDNNSLSQLKSIQEAYKKMLEEGKKKDEIKKVEKELEKIVKKLDEEDCSSEDDSKEPNEYGGKSEKENLQNSVKNPIKNEKNGD